MISDHKARHIWMPDNRTLCDRRAHQPIDLASMSDDEFEAFLAEQRNAPACGPCLLVAGRIRRLAGVILVESGGKIHPDRPSDGWSQLRGTRWANDLDLDEFLQRPDLDTKIRYEAINYAADAALVAEMVSERAASEQQWRDARASSMEEDEGPDA